MSLVTTTRSKRSRIDLQSISTSVVLPEPTGPPTPTRNGGSTRVRRGMWWSGVFIGDGWRASGSGAEQTRILLLVLRREDREHRDERLHLARRHRERAIEHRGNRRRERGEDALCRRLAERHRFQRRLRGVLGPAGGEAREDGARRCAAVGGGE